MSEYFKEIDVSAVNFAMNILRKEGIKVNIDKAITDGDDYTIRNVMVTGFTVKDKRVDGEYKDKGAIFFGTEGLVKIMLSYYPPIRFSLPKSQLLKYETEEYEILQTIKITDWGYKNCYILPINKILEDWGKMMRAHFRYYKTKNWDDMFRCSSYKKVVDDMNKSDIRDAINEIKKRNEGNLIKGKDGNRKVGKQERNKEPFRRKAVYTFQVDGSGNVTNNEKFKDTGHYSVWCRNTQEKWKKKEERLTSNVAELKAVLSAMHISIQRGYESVVIETDSNNAVQWYEENWKARAEHIIPLVEKMLEFKKKIPNIILRKIERSKNFAHGI